MNLEEENKSKMLENVIVENEECGIEFQEELVEEVEIVKEKEGFNGNEAQLEKKQPNC